MIFFISAGWPNKCTGTIALVFGVIAFSSFSQSMLNDLRSTSTKTGLRFNNAITSTVAAKVKFEVITSSPGFRSNDIIAICNASVPFAHGITCFTCKYSSRFF